uniref:Uncharacterized protein n=1 Tax=Timema tahoe TaxID=61484 RepID=A0A7R9IC91_9NEOP|nr:unnamed protein product [Timema tahoe]
MVHLARLCELFNVFADISNVPDDWENAVTVPLYKGKGIMSEYLLSSLSAGSFRDDKLLPFRFSDDGNSICFVVSAETQLIEIDELFEFVEKSADVQRERDD